MYFILETDLQNQEYSTFNEPIQSLSKEDVATILEVFEATLKNYNSSSIANILKNSEGKFLCLIGQYDYGFDFYYFLNQYYVDKTVVIDCTNVRFLFPQELSRGEYIPSVSSQDIYSDSTDVLTTEQIEGLTKLHQLYHIKANTPVQITNMGVTIGRSAKDANYVIEGNHNISRCHALVYVYNDFMYVRDNNSTNGTYVNGKQAAPQVDVRLNIGDEVKFADERFVVR